MAPPLPNEWLFALTVPTSTLELSWAPSLALSWTVCEALCEALSLLNTCEYSYSLIVIPPSMFP